MLWEQATHVPLIVVDKRFAKNGGIRCNHPVSLLDVYPTLSDLCNFQPPNHLEGESLRPLLLDPATESPRAVVTTYQFRNHSIRSQDWRYIRYADGSEELYDHRVDPSERNNLVGTKGTADIVKRLAHSLPKKNAPQKNVRKLRNR